MKNSKGVIVFVGLSLVIALGIVLGVMTKVNEVKPLDIPEGFVQTQYNGGNWETLTWLDKSNQAEFLIVKVGGSYQTAQIMLSPVDPFFNLSESIGNRVDFYERFSLKGSYIVDNLSGSKFLIIEDKELLIQVFE